MSSFPLLDVAIAMIFLFLLLSLVCSAANELISAMLQARARFLERGIYRLLETPEFTQKLYDHALIRNLCEDVNPVLARLGHKPLPAYIPARTFALVVMDLVEPGAGTRNALASDAIEEPSGFSKALDQANLPPTVKTALLALTEAAGRNAASTRQQIEEWYNSTMDRVSGAYKRRTQYALFGLGILATIAVNADSVRVAERLATDKTLAASVADAAERFSKDMNARGGLEGATAESDRGRAVEKARISLDDTLNTLDKLGLPIGWNGPGKDNTFRLPSEEVPRAAIRLFWDHWIGWLITALAISFGAPFWFDLLNRFMVVRSTVKPKEKSEVEQSKD